MKSKPIVGISMKIYKNISKEMINYTKKMKDLLENKNEVEVFILPSMGTLYPVSQELHNSTIQYGAQNMGPKENGAYTGELSVESLVDMGASLVEIGHFERRKFFNETNAMIADKVQLAIKNNITPLVCIGETEKLNEVELKEYLFKQVEEGLVKIDKEDVSKVIFAYEPGWAIGKEESASSDHIHVAHGIIKDILSNIYNSSVSVNTRIIYGGSVSASNASVILNHPSVSGLFVGRFGHDIENFAKIVDITKQIKAAK